MPGKPGPRSNGSTLRVRTHGPGAGLRFGALVVVLACIAGLITDAVIGPATGVPMHAHGNEQVGLLSWACLIVLAGVFLYSLWRNGPRAMLRSLMESEPHQH